MHTRVVAKYGRSRRGRRFWVWLLAPAALTVVLPSAAARAATPPTVSAVPADTPSLATTGVPEVVRQLVQCGSTMYAVGRFTAIQYHGRVYRRSNAFSFAATAPYAPTSWNPDVDGEVNSITFLGTGCSDAYLGGNFSAVGRAPAQDIAEVSTGTGAVVTRFARSANRPVETLAVSAGQLLVGGFFTSINGGHVPYFASLDPTTGVPDGYLNLDISGHYQYPGVSGNHTRVYNQQISHNGKLDLVEGDFTSVGGRHRQQIFMLALGGSRATVTAWTSTEFYQNCATIEPFYIRAASWSPDDATVYVATTGFHPDPGGTHGPRTGLCDAAAAFPATQTTVTDRWINYTGCDSLYSTAAGADTVYFGGHERWADNSHGCNAPGPGAVPAPGMVGLSPTTGAVVFDPTRSRGYGADDMLLTADGLWIASDNFRGANRCAGKAGHAGICFLPYG